MIPTPCFGKHRLKLLDLVSSGAWEAVRWGQPTLGWSMLRKQNFQVTFWFAKGSQRTHTHGLLSIGVMYGLCPEPLPVTMSEWHVSLVLISPSLRPLFIDGHRGEEKRVAYHQSGFFRTWWKQREQKHCSDLAALSTCRYYIWSCKINSHTHCLDLMFLEVHWGGLDSFRCLHKLYFSKMSFSSEEVEITHTFLS